MARNKHPEETVNLILDVASRLFMEKGYEHTSIQDIIDNLGGLSKGAIYHHFKSKEDILEAVTDKMSGESEQMFAAICERGDLTGKEKLKMFFKESLFRPGEKELFQAAPNIGKSPGLFYSMVRSSVVETAREYILPIIRQGIADGSIRTEYPAELAELLMFTANVWMNPMTFGNSAEEACRKFLLFRQMTEGLGLDIMDDESLERLRELALVYEENR